MKSKIFDQNWYDKEKSEKITFPDVKDKNEVPKYQFGAQKVEFINKVFKKKVPNDFIFNEYKNNDKVTKTLKEKLFFNRKQHRILKYWLKECKKVYNKCVEKYNEDPENFNLSYKKTKIEIFKELYENTKKPVPYDVLTDEIKRFCEAVKSNLTAIENNNRKKFLMKKKEYSSIKTYSIYISYSAISKNGIYTGILGKQPRFRLKYIYNDARMIYNQKNGHIDLHYISQDKTDSVKSKKKTKIQEKYISYLEKNPIKNNENKLNNDRKEICSLDQGEKIFITYYSLDGYGTIGDNIRKRILEHEEKIRRYQRICSQKKNKDGTKLKHMKSIRSKIQNVYKKIHNLVSELHYKTSLYLCQNYKRIIVPPFETSKMVKNKKEIMTDFSKTEFRKIRQKQRLNKRVKFVLNMLSMYKFHQILKNKCIEYGTEYIEDSEDFTSKICTKCGQTSEHYDKRNKICDHCNFTIDRDLNGSRNILIKSISKCFRTS